METKENIKFYFGIVAVALAFLIIAGGFILVFIRYRRKIVLKQQELLKLDSQHKQELLANNIESAETERMSIAKDIHDEIGSIFSTLSLSLHKMKVGSVVLPEALETSNRLIEMGLSCVRRISHSLAPFELELLGLNQALENHFITITEISDLATNYKCTADLAGLQPGAELAIYRIMQELTSNSIKYAQAKNIIAYIENSGDELKLTYNDDGVGTDMQDPNISRGMGLKNIESRVLVLNGRVNFVSQPGKGFSCVILISKIKNTGT